MVEHCEPGALLVLCLSMHPCMCATGSDTATKDQQSTGRRQQHRQPLPLAQVSAASEEEEEDREEEEVEEQDACHTIIASGQQGQQASSSGDGESSDSSEEDEEQEEEGHNAARAVVQQRAPTQRNTAPPANAAAKKRSFGEMLDASVDDSTLRSVYSSLPGQRLREREACHAHLLQQAPRWHLLLR